MPAMQSLPLVRRWRFALAAIAVVMTFVPRAGSSSGRPTESVRGAASARWSPADQTHLTSRAAVLSVDAADRVARLSLSAGVPDSRDPELNFNGTSMGELELRVPIAWTVAIDFSNLGQERHSARVVSDVELPVHLEKAVMRGAETPNATTGSPMGAHHLVTFVAARAGRFRIACAVPAHAFSGMWIRLTVDSAATEPSLRQN